MNFIVILIKINVIITYRLQLLGVGLKFEIYIQVSKNNLQERVDLIFERVDLKLIVKYMCLKISFEYGLN